MHVRSWQVRFSLGLIALSAILYLIHFLIFQDAHHIAIYLLGDIAFVPIEVLLVTIVIHSLLDSRQKQALMEKLNMLIGAFFSEVGQELLIEFSDLDPRLHEIKNDLAAKGSWTDKEFAAAMYRLTAYDFAISADLNAIKRLQPLIIGKRDFMIRMLENPNLLEHETFTELLRAVFHLTEELASRGHITELPQSDIDHLRIDINRAYALIVKEWVSYMKHLKTNYPYLFSLALRLNPFDETASPIVE